MSMIEKDMPSDARDLDPRVRVLLRILTELERSGSQFALLHAEDQLPPDVSSDVDMAFAQSPSLVIEPILQRLAHNGELTIVQRLHYDVLHGYYYILRIPGASLQWLHLDCLCDPLGVNRYHLPTTYLLDGAAQAAYGRRIDKRKEAVYLLMKRAVKGKLSARGLDVLRSRFRDAAGDALWSDVRHWFGPGARSQVEALLQVDAPAAAGVWLSALAKAATRRARWRRPLLAARATLMQTGRKWRRFLQPTRLFVVIVGPDGSGKS